MNIEKLSIPAAIVVAGLLVAVAIFAKDMPRLTPSEGKTPAARSGVNEKKLQACAATDQFNEKIQKQIETGSRALEVIPAENRGTPYNILVDTKTGTKVQFAGAYPYEAFKQAIDGMLAGTAIGEAIDLEPISSEDHFFGNKDAQIVIVEYGDLECPYCALAHPTIKKIIAAYDGKVAWVFRHYPLSIHKNAHIKAVASECAWQQGGDEAFFKYLDATYKDLEAKVNPQFDTSTL